MAAQKTAESTTKSAQTMVIKNSNEGIDSFISRSRESNSHDPIARRAAAADFASMDRPR